MSFLTASLSVAPASISVSGPEPEAVSVPEPEAASLPAPSAVAEAASMVVPEVPGEADPVPPPSPSVESSSSLSRCDGKCLEGIEARLSRMENLLENCSRTLESYEESNQVIVNLLSRVVEFQERGLYRLLMYVPLPGRRSLSPRHRSRSRSRSRSPLSH